MRYLALAIVTTITGCTVSAPSTPAPQREPTLVNAPFDRTWIAVIDQFAERNTPIETLDKSSGFVATHELGIGVSRDVAITWADCGSAIGVAIMPERATYNVRVRGDSLRSTVQVMVRWTQGGRSAYDRLIECVSRGGWEQDFEDAVKAQAETP